MKKYFTIYLLLEREIKEGDIFIYEKQVIKWHDNDYCKLMFPTRPKPVKLFLCSRDIQVGGEVYWIDPDENLCSGYKKLEELHEEHVVMTTSTSETVAPRNEVFKVIGEISPDALEYVKEGDQFEEYNWYHDFLECKNYIQIKGPCGHYH